MELTIVSPKKTVTHEIAWLELATDVGSFVIQPGHAPTVLLLSANQEIIFRLTTGKQESIAIQHGIADITRSSVTLIVKN